MRVRGSWEGAGKERRGAGCLVALVPGRSGAGRDEVVEGQTPWLRVEHCRVRD